jgi:hypothetical protein
MRHSSPSSEHRTGDSYAERIAAFRRVYGETLLLDRDLRAYWKRTRDHAAGRLAAIQTRISDLVGPDRDRLDGLGERELAEYKRLAAMERDEKVRETTAREMLDRHETSGLGDEDEYPNEEPRSGGQRAASGRRDGEQAPAGGLDPGVPGR